MGKDFFSYLTFSHLKGADLMGRTKSKLGLTLSFLKSSSEMGTSALPVEVFFGDLFFVEFSMALFGLTGVDFPSPFPASESLAIPPSPASLQV